MKTELLSVATVLAFTIGGAVYLQTDQFPPVSIGAINDLRLSLLERGATSPGRAVNLNTITLAGGGGCSSTDWGHCDHSHNPNRC